MSISTIAVWCRNLSKEDIFNAVSIFTMLIYTNEIAWKCAYLYCYAISIIINENDPAKAYEMAKREA